MGVLKQIIILLTQLILLFHSFVEDSTVFERSATLGLVVLLMGVSDLIRKNDE